MNLGGPDSLDAVRPFLFNLFSDPAILRLPSVLRLPLARVIAWRRTPVAREIYRRLGGGSPLLANTRAQARELEAVLGRRPSLFCGDALLAPDEQGDRSRGGELGTRRDRLSAALSAILDDHDGFIAGGVANGRKTLWHRPPGAGGLLLSRRSGLRRSGGQADSAGARRGCRFRQAATTAADGSWTAEKDRKCR